MSDNNIAKFTRSHFLRKNMGVRICVNHLEKMHHRKHEHEFIEIAYIANGCATQYINDKEYQVRHGNLLFINYKQVHEFKVDDKSEIIDVLIDPSWISDKLIDSDNAFELLTLSSFSPFSDGIDTDMSVIYFDSKERAVIESILRTMYSEYKKCALGYETMLKSLTLVLLTLIFRKMSGTKDDFSITPEFLQYIRDNCDQKLTLEELSKKCFYNPSYFSRLFREHYGITLTDFILNSRFERACDLLQNSDLSTEEIARRSGFGSKSAFYKFFKEKTGVTPGEYRKMTDN